MKEGLAAIIALLAILLIHFANKRIIGDRTVWKGRRIQPRGTYVGGFPIVPTSDCEVEKKNSTRWAWVLADLLILVMLAIWFVARFR